MLGKKLSERNLYDFLNENKTNANYDRNNAVVRLYTAYTYHIFINSYVSLFFKTCGLRKYVLRFNSIRFLTA